MYAQAPMPPGQSGPFEGVPMGDLGQDVYPSYQPDNGYGQQHGGAGFQDGFHAYDNNSDNNGKSKKNKKNKGGKDFDRPMLETTYVGYFLAKAPAVSGANSTWKVAERSPMPLDQKALLAIVREQRTKGTLLKDLEPLTGAQRELLNRLLEEHRYNEKNRNAEWVAAYVKRELISTSVFRAPPLDNVRRIQVILKRHDKDYSKPKVASKGTGPRLVHERDIIDLNDTGQKNRKSKDKGNKTGIRQTRSYEDVTVGNDHNGWAGAGGFDPHTQQQQPMHQGFQQPFQPMQEQTQFPGHMHAPPMQPPPMNMPFDHGGQYPPTIPPLTRSHSMHQPDINPFQSDHFAAPDPYEDMPQYNDERTPRRSKSQRRRSSPGRRDRRDRDLERNMSNLNVGRGSSVDSLEEGRSLWSGERRYEHDYTPDTSPHRRDFGNSPKRHSRSGRYRHGSADLEVGYPRRRDSHRDDREYYYRSSRPQVLRVHTTDDYLYPHESRRLREYENERYEYRDDYDRRRPRDRSELIVTRRRSPGRYDDFRDDYCRGDGRRRPNSYWR